MRLHRGPAAVDCAGMVRAVAAAGLRAVLGGGFPGPARWVALARHPVWRERTDARPAASRPRRTGLCAGVRAGAAADQPLTGAMRRSLQGLGLGAVDGVRVPASAAFARRGATVAATVARVVTPRTRAAGRTQVPLAAGGRRLRCSRCRRCRRTNTGRLPPALDAKA